MPSPRSLMLALLGLFALAGGYLGYASVLGRIDGLPPLPPRYIEAVQIDGAPKFVPRTNKTDQRLREAFGPNCRETKYEIKLDLRSKGLLLAWNDYRVEDGKAVLWPFSMAMYKKRSRTETEINTLHASRAVIEFDRPIQSVAEIAERKLTAAHLYVDPDSSSDDPRRGYIHVTHNRRTPDPQDDLIMKTPGPLHYLTNPQPDPVTTELGPHLWTDSVVVVIDRQNTPGPDINEYGENLVVPRSGPRGQMLSSDLGEFFAGRQHPPTIRGERLQIYFEVEETPSPDGTHKMGNVRQIDLGSNVAMHLWIDADENFVIGNSNDADPLAELPDSAREVAETLKAKALLRIHTLGPFRYDLTTDKAYFDIPDLRDPRLPYHVMVERIARRDTSTDSTGANSFVRDVLSCDSLELTMGSSDTEDQPRQESSPVGPQISHVRATGEIGVGSDRELMQAWGSELTYDRPTGETVLTGSPMHVAKDGHLITATQLVMSGLDDEATQQARVKGPGRVEIGPVGPDGRINPLRSADWQDWLIYSKEPRDEGEPLELLTLTGNAAFRDTEAGQSLAAREIKVWLQPPNDESRTRGSDPTDQRRPERLLATADVYIRSPKLHVEGADHLEIRFRDLPPPEVAVAKTPMNQDATIPPVPPAEPATPVAIRGVMPTPSTEEADSQTSLGMPAEPLVLKAGRVDAWMDRQGEKTEMDRVVCQERVHARQMPNRDNPDGVELAGDVLSLRHTPDGDLLTITAEKRLARAEMIKLPVERQVDREGRVLPTVVKGPARKALSVLGNDIFIDQRNNFAEVKGAGSMYLLSESDLQGKPLEEPSYVHILWADRMEFYGAEKWARFEGDVQATQMESRVSCQNMHVTLDREVWFNPDERPDKDQTERTGSPKIEYVLCDQLPADPDKAKSDRRVPLTLEDRQYDDDRNLIELQRVIAPEIQVDNLSSVMKASGPGVVRVFQPGSKGDPLDGPQPQPRPNSATKEPETEMKLIWVEYRGRMKIQKTPRKATFYDGIDALYAPSDDPEMKPDLVNLPERGLHLRCSDRLVVSELESPDGTKSQELRAFGNAFARSADFRGSAEQINYDQSKETITFVGSKDNPARLMRFIVPGRQGQEVSGSKIIYYRLTRDFKMEDGLRFSGSDR